MLKAKDVIKEGMRSAVVLAEDKEHSRSNDAELERLLARVVVFTQRRRDMKMAQTRPKKIGMWLAM